MYNTMSSGFVAASAATPITAPIPADRAATINPRRAISVFEIPSDSHPNQPIPPPNPAPTAAPTAAPIHAPSPNPSFQESVIVWMSVFGITGRSAGLRSSRDDVERPRSWPLIRSSFFRVTVMGDAICKAETFSQRPGITPACAGMEINPARNNETSWLRQDFMVWDLITTPPSVVGLLPPVDRPHRGQEERIKKCDFFAGRGSRKPRVTTACGVSNHLESFGLSVLTAAGPAARGKSLCSGGTS